MIGSERKAIGLVLMVAAAALGTGLWHGLPQVYVPDTHIIRNALGMAQNMDLWPASGLYSTYPYLLAYLLLPVYAVTFLVGRAFGFYDSAEAFGRSVIEDPTVVYLEARIMVALFGLAAVYYLFRTARRIGLPVFTAAAAGLFLALNPLFVQLGHQSRPWIPVVAGMAFTLYYSARITLDGRKQDYFLAALGAGLTFAMHQVGGVALILPGAAVLARQGQTLVNKQRLLALLSVLLVFTGSAFCLGYGHLVFGGPATDVQPLDKSALDLGGQKLVWELFGAGGSWKTISAFFGYDPILAVFGLLGLGLAVCSRAFHGIRFALGATCGFLLAFFLAYNNRHIRYMLPLMPGLALGAAYLATRVAERLGWKPGWLLVPLLLFSGIQTARLDLLLCRTDTRDLARAWIEAELPTHTRLVAEGYTAPIEADRDSLAFLAGQDGVWLRRKETLILQGSAGPRTGPVYYLIPLERFYEYKSYWPHQYILGEPRAVAGFLDDMQAQWLMLSDRWPRVERFPPGEDPSPLLDFIAARTEPGPVFSPTNSADPDEATLPMDMTFPLTALWEMERPGPVIRLFKIRP